MGLILLYIDYFKITEYWMQNKNLRAIKLTNGNSQTFDLSLCLCDIVKIF